MLTRNCPHWPSAKEVGFCDPGKTRMVRARIYEALRNRGKLTIDEIREVAWQDGGQRKDASINVLLMRMQRHLTAHGIVIVREVGNGAYRLEVA